MLLITRDYGIASCLPLRSIENGWKKTTVLNSEYLGRELNLRVTVNMRL